MIETVGNGKIADTGVRGEVGNKGLVEEMVLNIGLLYPS